MKYYFLVFCVVLVLNVISQNKVFFPEKKGFDKKGERTKGRQIRIPGNAFGIWPLDPCMVRSYMHARHVGELVLVLVLVSTGMNE